MTINTIVACIIPQKTEVLADIRLVQIEKLPKAIDELKKKVGWKNILMRKSEKSTLLILQPCQIIPHI